jgi:antitoxin VapB
MLYAAMALRIKNERVHQLAKELAAMTGETLESAVCCALEEELAEIERKRAQSSELRSQRVDSSYVGQGRS